MLFDYRAADSEGRIQRGRLDALNPPDLESRLRRLDLELVSARPAAKWPFSLTGGVSRRELIHFYFHLEQAVASGIPLLDSLADLQDSAENERFRQVVASLRANIEGGRTLSQAMADHPYVFNSVMANLVAAGETAGRLPQVLAELTATLKWEDELASHSRKLLLYPAFVGAIVAAAAFFLLAHTVPQLKQFVASLGQSLPLPTRILFHTSDLLLAHWPIFLLTPAIFGLAVQLVLARSPGARLRADGAKLRIPLLGNLLKKITLCRFAGTFAMLYSAGIPILECLNCARGVVGNRAVQGALEDVAGAIQEGQKLSEAFDESDIFPALVVRMLRIGESTGNLDTALRNASYFYDRDIRESTEKAQALMEPALTLSLGALLGWIMLSVIGPIYDVISTVRL